MVGLITLLFDALVMLVSIKLISGKDDDELSIPTGMIISFFVAIVTVVLLVVFVESMGLMGILFAVLGGSFVLAIAVMKVFNVEAGKAFIIAGIFFAVKFIREFAFYSAVDASVGQSNITEYVRMTLLA